MPLPTTGVYFSGSNPAAPPGDQVATPQTDGQTPQQSITFVPQRATTALRGTVKPDGVTILIDGDGTISAPAGGGGTGGAPHQETPAGPIDGSNLAYSLSAAPIGGIVVYTRDGVQEDPSTYTITGTVLTRTVALQPATGSRLAERHLITYWA